MLSPLVAAAAGTGDTQPAPIPAPSPAALPQNSLAALLQGRLGVTLSQNVCIVRPARGERELLTCGEQEQIGAGQTGKARIEP